MSDNDVKRMTQTPEGRLIAHTISFPGIHHVDQSGNLVSHPDNRSDIPFSGRADELHYPDDMVTADAEGTFFIKRRDGKTTKAGSLEKLTTSSVVTETSPARWGLTETLADFDPVSRRSEIQGAADAAEAWIRGEVDRNMWNFYLFAGGDFGNNRALFTGNFSEQGIGSELYDFAPLPSSLLESSRSNGCYAKRWTVDLSVNQWASINFQTGVLLNDGSIGPSSGLTSESKVDLSGHRRLRLTLWAEADTKCTVRTGDATPEHPDSTTRVLAPEVQLTTSPQEFTFDFTNEDDLSAMDTFLTLGVDRNIAAQQVHTIYVARAYYEATDRSREPIFDGCWIKSWTTSDPRGEFDIIMQNVSFVYDQALALCVMLAASARLDASSEQRTEDLRRAWWLAHAIIYAVENDSKYNDGRVRNAYRCGPMRAPPGFEQKRGARLPGWWPREGISRDGSTIFVGEEGVYGQDEYAVSTWTGNVAWAAIALCAFARNSTPKESQQNMAIEAAERMGDFLLNRAKFDGFGGFSGGMFGFDGTDQTELRWRSTEHAADVYAACAQLQKVTFKVKKWEALQRHALLFTDRMYHVGSLPATTSSPSSSSQLPAALYWTGTSPDGTINKSNLPLDPILWTIYGTGGHRKDAVRLDALRWADRELRLVPGDPFSLAKYSRVSEGGWIEGTGQLAVAFNEYGFSDRSTASLVSCLPHQTSRGGFYSVDREAADTGFDLPGTSGRKWSYFRREHVGATCWFALAASFRNPFTMPHDGCVP